VWNVCGINSQGKWDALRDKITESAASVVCLQETKREHFDSSYLRKFCPRQLDKFAFQTSVGASGVLLIVWNGALFDGYVLQFNSYAISVKLTSQLSGSSFCLTNIYGPSTFDGKVAFINWLYNFDTAGFSDWILVGDFNLIRFPNDRNRGGGNVDDMLLFNDLIQHLDLAKINFHGRRFS
jgi:exonuclease III